MKHSYQEVDEHIQWLMNFMKEEYPNDFELVLDSSFAAIKSKLTTLTFLREDIRTPACFTEKVPAIERIIEDWNEAENKVLEDIKALLEKKVKENQNAD